MADSELRSRTATFLSNASDEITSLLSGATITATLDQALYDEANALVQDLAVKGSAEFSATMMGTWDELRLEEQIGEETTQIWDNIQRSHIYLPVIIRTHVADLK